MKIKLSEIDYENKIMWSKIKNTARTADTEIWGPMISFYSLQYESLHTLASKFFIVRLNACLGLPWIYVLLFWIWAWEIDKIFTKKFSDREFTQLTDCHSDKYFSCFICKKISKACKKIDYLTKKIFGKYG